MLGTIIIAFCLYAVALFFIVADDRSMHQPVRANKKVK